jgi:hypothetical protein
VSEDYELYLRIARDYPICCHAAVVAEYRMHQTNLSHNSALMLTTTLRVLRREARYVRSDAGRLFAFLEGIRTWQRQYGRRLASELARSGSTVPVNDYPRKLLLLVNHYPQGLMMILLLRVILGFGRRNAMDEKSLSLRVHAWLNTPRLFLHGKPVRHAPGASLFSWLSPGTFADRDSREALEVEFSAAKKHTASSLPHAYFARQVAIDLQCQGREVALDEEGERQIAARLP